MSDRACLACSTAASDTVFAAKAALTSRASATASVVRPSATSMSTAWRLSLATSSPLSSGTAWSSKTMKEPV